MQQELAIHSLLNNKVGLYVRIAVGFGLLAYLGFSGAIQLSFLSSLVGHLYSSIIAVCILALITALTSLRLYVLLNASNLRFSFRSSIRFTLIGNFFSAFLPGMLGGDLFRFYYALKEVKGKRIDVAMILLLDRITGFLALILSPFFVAVLFPFLLTSTFARRLFLWNAAIVCGALMAIVLFSRFAQARQYSKGLRYGGIRKYFNRMVEVLSFYRERPAALFSAMAISLLVQTLLIAVMLLLARVTNPEGTNVYLIFLIPFGFLANTLPFTPGGLGIGEIAFERLFALSGASGGAETLLAWRLLTTIVDIWGLPFYIQGRKFFADEHAFF